jgi:hypothetical protein
MPDTANSLAKLRRRLLGRAYERDLWRGAAPRIGQDRLGVAGANELLAWFQDAWARRDWDEIEQFGQALKARGLLSPGNSARLRLIQVMLGRPEEALAMAPSRAASPWDAVALAAVGRMEEARARLAEIDPGTDPEVTALLGRAIGEPHADAWSPETGQVAAALELHCGDLAADLAVQALGRAIPEGDELLLMLQMLQCCFRLASPLAARRLLDAMTPLIPPSDHEAYEAVRRLPEGGPDAGPIMAVTAGEEPRFTLAVVLAHACAAVGRNDAAVRRLCQFDALDLKGTEHLFELARLVGAAERLAPSYAPSTGRRKVFDVFPFNGEFGLLDLKLETMGDWVDRFVLVEAARTFTGRPKPLYFQEAKDRYAAWADKIVHVVVESEPDFIRSTWAREYHQRDQGVRGLSGLCAPEDLVLISDVDEIVDPAVLEGFEQPFASIGMRTFNYFLNYERIPDRGVRRKAGVVQARMLQGAGLSSLRVGMSVYSKRWLRDGGWHFSFLLTPEDILLKLRSYSHQENNSGSAESHEQILESIRGGWRHPDFERVPIDETFPPALRDLPERYAPFVLPESGS